MLRQAIITDLYSRTNKENKNAKPFSVRLEQGVYDDLCSYCEKSGQSKTVAVERAIVMYMKAYDADQKLLTDIKK